ncbi:NYN domain-containing protein [Verrucomicrobia bacterium S94]|nr:NYN domain-containing protein [Verrucomicrobia bacterium S94]
MNKNTDKKIAVLIDAENASYKVLSAVMTELSKHGHIVVKKAYGDWSSKHLVNWKQPLNDLAINPVQQFSYTQGKNSSDAALIIDAMDLLYSNQYDAFALITSDSDFTKLASRLKESQIYVFGVGEKKTPKAFRSACDDFILTELLNTEEEEEEPPKKSAKKAPKKAAAKTTEQKTLKQNTKLVKTLRDAVAETADDDGWARASTCGSLIKRQYSDFDPREYGYKTFPLLYEGIGLFEIERRKSGNGNAMFVKDKKK